MQASDFTRYDCQVGRKRKTYKTLTREWKCSDCGGHLGEKWSDGNERYPDNWHVECLKCGSTDFIHEYAIARQQAEADDAIDGLPPELAKLLKGELWH